jgi:glutamyl-tRNA synthetase
MRSRAGRSRAGRSRAGRSRAGAASAQHAPRAALTGRTNSPGVAEVMALLGREESLGRLADVLA